jgi:hypothetical protein
MYFEFGLHLLQPIFYFRLTAPDRYRMDKFRKWATTMGAFLCQGFQHCSIDFKPKQKREEEEEEIAGRDAQKKARQICCAF